MRLRLIAVYHNTTSWFMEYEDGHDLTQVISHWRHWPDGTDPIEIAEWAFRVFNADLDMLEPGRRTTTGEADFLIACVYRLMHRRSLSVGDVIAITTEGITTWLACDPLGWRQITEPATTTGQPLTAEAVYQHPQGGDDE